MKQVAGIWLPDGEAHLVPFLEDQEKWVGGRGSYQHHKLTAALQYVTGQRRAIDVGAHVGLWSMQMVELFDSVIAFEPLDAHCDCFKRNVDMRVATLLPCALGDRNDSVALQSVGDSSGDSWISGPGDLPMRRFDDLGFDAMPIDFMKVDCEGYELFVLRGAEQTLLRHKPVVVVEQKPGRAERFGLGETDALRFLESLGASMRETLSGDYVLSW